MIELKNDTGQVKLNPQEYLITIYAKVGGEIKSFEQKGFIAKVNGFPISVFPILDYEDVYLSISDIQSGRRIKRVQLTDEEFLSADTKEKFLKLLERKLLVYSLFLNNEMIEKIKEQRKKYEVVKSPIADHKDMVKKSERNDR